jgi:hypothetical protein
VEVVREVAVQLHRDVPVDPAPLAVDPLEPVGVEAGVDDLQRQRVGGLEHRVIERAVAVPASSSTSMTRFVDR